MSDTAGIAEEAHDEGLEIQAGNRSATIGAVEAAQEQERIAIRESNGSGRTGAEHAEAEAWAYDDPSSKYGRRRR